MTQESTKDIKPMLAAIEIVHDALKELEPEIQKRVLDWVAVTLNIDSSRRERKVQPRDEDQDGGGLDASAEDEPGETNGILQAISPPGKKWIARNGLQPEKLSPIFNLRGEEIDLIANKVPGRNTKERMRSVFLLKGVAAYLGTGAARFTHEQMKEACLHYDAFDAGNFALYFKSLSSEVTGNKATGYTLTPRGLANATEMVKAITQP